MSIHLRLHPLPGGHRLNGQSRLERHLAGYESSSTLLTSELETTSLCDSDDDDTMSRYWVGPWTERASLWPRAVG